jgi:hypothetical protein
MSLKRDQKLKTLADLAICGLKYQIRHAPVGSPVDRSKASILMNAFTEIKQSEATSPSIYRVMSLLTTLNSMNTVNVGFSPLEPVRCTDKQQLSGWFFKQATLDWWFMYAQHKDFAFTLIVFRVPACPPAVVSDKKFQSEAQLYSITGGVGHRGGPWFSIPWQPVLGNYHEQ